MINDAYYFYRESCINLANSVVLKNSRIAEKMNEQVELYALAKNLDAKLTYKENWRYYKHIAGEYHHFDTTMYVRSHDTLENIVFSVENLKLHRTTKDAYKKGTVEYENLVSRYPEQITLINGILNPVDKAKAIKAEDYDILAYDKSLVDYLEQPLMHDLEVMIKKYLYRYDVKGYHITDDLWETCRIVTLYIMMPIMIMEIRLGYAKTNYSCDFHIWAYLGSKLKLDEFKDYLLPIQKLWLVRNIDWILTTNGRPETFNSLIDYIMTRRQLPIHKYLMRTDSSEVAQFKSAILPEKIPLNNIQVSDITKRKYSSVSELLTKELNKATQNPDLIPKIINAIEYDFKVNNYTNLDTKVLESDAVDYSAMEVYPIFHIIMNYWVWCVDQNLMHNIISVTNPKTGETMACSARDALIMFIYASLRCYGLKCDPKDFYALDLIDYRVPDWNSIAEQIPKNVDIANEFAMIRDNYPVKSKITSIYEFREYCEAIKEYYDLLRLIHSNTNGLSRTEAVSDVISKIKFSKTCDVLGKYISFEDYVNQTGWSLEGYDTKLYRSLALAIFNKVSGAEFSTGTSYSNVQKAMIAIMERLSSYSVHFIGRTTGDEVVVIDTPMIKHDFTDGKYNSIIKNYTHNFPRAMDIKTKIFTTYYGVLDYIKEDSLKFKEKSKSNISTEISINGIKDVKHLYHQLKPIKHNIIEKDSTPPNYDHNGRVFHIDDNKQLYIIVRDTSLNTNDRININDLITSFECTDEELISTLIFNDARPTKDRLMVLSGHKELLLSLGKIPNNSIYNT